MNNSSSAPKESPTLHLIQASAGLVVLSFNVMVLVVFLTNRQLLMKSAFLVGMTIGNLFISTGYTISGFYRARLAVTDQYYAVVSVPYCLMTVIPELMLTAFCLPALLLSVIGIERLVALSQPIWYHSKWSQGKNWYVLLISTLLAFATTAVLSVISIYAKNGEGVPAHCSWSVSFGVGSAGALMIWSIIGGSFAIACTLVAFFVGLRHFKKLRQKKTDAAARARYKKQLRISKAMLSMVCLDFVFVVIPNIVFCLNFVAHVIDLPPVFISLCTYSYMTNAMLNVIAQFVFNSDFRNAVVGFLRLEQNGLFTIGTEVSPMS